MLLQIVYRTRFGLSNNTLLSYLPKPRHPWPKKKPRTRGLHVSKLFRNLQNLKKTESKHLRNILVNQAAFTVSCQSFFFVCVGGRGGIVESINVDTQALFSRERERERRETDTQVLSCKKAMLLKIKVLLL